MIIAEVGAQLAGKAGRLTGSAGHGTAGPGTAQLNRLALAPQIVDLAQSDGAVVATQTQLGGAVRLPQ